MNAPRKALVARDALKRYILSEAAPDRASQLGSQASLAANRQGRLELKPGHPWKTRRSKGCWVDAKEQGQIRVARNRRKRERQRIRQAGGR